MKFHFVKGYSSRDAWISVFFDPKKEFIFWVEILYQLFIITQEFKNIQQK